MKKTLLWIGGLAAAFLILTSFVRSQYEIPILMYHRVGYPDHKTPGLFVTPATFEKQMQFLKAHHYRVMSLQEAVALVKNGEKIPLNAVVITFDDGYLDNFNAAFPILKKMDFPATIFMITDNIGLDGWLEEEDLRILDDSGVTIGSHTLNHAFLPKLSAKEAYRQITQSKARLEEILDRPVTLFSYPAGGSTPELAQVVQEAGYEGAVTTNYGKTRHDPYRLHRIKIGDSRANLFNFWVKTSGLYHLGKKRVEGAVHGAEYNPR